MERATEFCGLSSEQHFLVSKTPHDHSQKAQKHHEVLLGRALCYRNFCAKSESHIHLTWGSSTSDLESFYLLFLLFGFFSCVTEFLEGSEGTEVPCYSSGQARPRFSARRLFSVQACVRAGGCQMARRNAILSLLAVRCQALGLPSVFS